MNPDQLERRLEQWVALLPGAAPFQVGLGSLPCGGRCVVVVGAARGTLPETWEGLPLVQAPGFLCVAGGAAKPAAEGTRASQAADESGPDFARRQHRERFGPQPEDTAIKAAAKELALHLSPAQLPLDFTVGEGSNQLFLYFRDRARPGTPGEWMGFPVVIRERVGIVAAN